MDTWFVLAVLGIAALCVAAYSFWGYLVFGRFQAVRQRLQRLIVEAIGETGNGATFLFVVERRAQAAEVRLPLEERELQRFREVLATRLRGEFPNVRVSVAPLTENLTHFHGAIRVWGRLHGNVYMGRGGGEHTDNAV